MIFPPPDGNAAVAARVYTGETDTHREGKNLPMKNARRLRPIAATVAAATLVVAAVAQQRRPPASQTETEIRERVGRVQSDLRAMHTAIESYKVDYNTVPMRLQHLTTPVAYLSNLFPDPFADVAQDATTRDEEIPLFEAPAGTLQFGWGEDLGLVIYSIGPDGVDGGGAEMYDPTNGALSGGDLVRMLEINGPVAPFLIGDEVRATRAMGGIARVRDAATAWAQEHNAWPSSVDDLTSPVAYLKEVPRDPFGGENAAIQIGAGENEGEVAIYSVGPDGDDDFGLLALRGIVRAGERPDGDLVEVLTRDDFHQARRGWHMPPPDEDPWLLAIKKKVAEDGRDNALLHYHDANRTAPPIPNDIQGELLQKVLREGWSEDTAALGPWLDLWNESFGHIRSGVAVDYAAGIGWEKGHATPVPNFLHAQTAGKALCASSARKLAQGDTEGALDDALTALKFGCDMGAEGGVLISSLISIALENVALRQIGNVVASGALTREQLDRVRFTLEHVERASPGAAAGFRGEREAMRVSMQEVVQQISAGDAVTKEEAERIDALMKEYGVTRQELLRVIGRVSAANVRMFDAMIADMAKPVSERRTAEQVQEIAASALSAQEREMFACAIPNFTEAGVRDASAVARLRMARLETALHAWKLGGGAAPATLDALVPAHLNAVPADPFTGAPLNYRAGEDGRSWTIWSVGPDLASQDAGLRYDPTNGTVSDGDVLLKF